MVPDSWVELEGEERENWEINLRNLRDELEATNEKIFEKLRRAKLKAYKLSLTRVIG